MAFKAAFLVMAPDSDPKVHRASIKSPKLELTTVMIQLWNTDQAVDVSKALVQNDGVQALILCPGFAHEAVAKVKAAVGENIPVNVARGDISSVMITSEILAREGWFSQ